MTAYDPRMETLDDQTRVAVDERPRRRRMLPVFITGMTVLAAGVYLRAVDPNVPGHYPGCPSQIFLGLDCPGCGGMRGTYDLLYGDLSGMADHNILLLIFWPVVIVAFAVWAYRSWTGRRPVVDIATQARRSRLMVWLLIGVLIFGVVRNFVPYLGSGVG